MSDSIPGVGAGGGGGGVGGGLAGEGIGGGGAGGGGAMNGNGSNGNSTATNSTTNNAPVTPPGQITAQDEEEFPEDPQNDIHELLNPNTAAVFIARKPDLNKFSPSVAQEITAGYDAKQEEVMQRAKERVEAMRRGIEEELAQEDWEQDEDPMVADLYLKQIVIPTTEDVKTDIARKHQLANFCYDLAGKKGAKHVGGRGENELPRIVIVTHDGYVFGLNKVMDDMNKSIANGYAISPPLVHTLTSLGEVVGSVGMDSVAKQNVAFNTFYRSSNEPTIYPLNPVQPQQPMPSVICTSTGQLTNICPQALANVDTSIIMVFYRCHTWNPKAVLKQLFNSEGFDRKITCFLVDGEDLGAHYTKKADGTIELV